MSYELQDFWDSCTRIRRFCAIRAGSWRLKCCCPGKLPSENEKFTRTSTLPFFLIVPDICHYTGTGGETIGSGRSPKTPIISFPCAPAQPIKRSSLQTSLNTLVRNSRFSVVYSRENRGINQKLTWFFAKLTCFCGDTHLYERYLRRRNDPAGMHVSKE